MANYFKPVQLSYSQNPKEAVLGQLANTMVGHRSDSRIMRGFGRAGFGVFLSSGASAPANAELASSIDPGEVYHQPNGATGAAADVDAIHSGASSASIQTITSFNGVLADQEIQPPRQVTAIFDASTDWDPTTAVLTYVDENGDTVSENLSVASSASLTTTGKVKRVVKLVIPAQTGAGGTFTLGVAAIAAETEARFAGVIIRPLVHRALSSDLLYGLPGFASTPGGATFVDGEGVACLKQGEIWAASETAVADGDPVYVRTAVSGSFLVLGAFANAAGTGRVLLNGAKFARSCAAPASASLYTPAWMKLNLL